MKTDPQHRFFGTHIPPASMIVPVPAFLLSYFEGGGGGGGGDADDEEKEKVRRKLLKDKDTRRC
jgi:hypothetical protein